MRIQLLGHLFRGAGGHESAAAVAAFRAQVDEVVCGLDDLQVTALVPRFNLGTRG